jgi:hypothetical protein
MVSPWFNLSFPTKKLFLVMIRKFSYSLFKKASTVLFFAGIFFYTQPLQAQQATHSSGGNGSGTGGTFAYSVGQTVYTAQSNSTTSLSQGVQQVFEISLITGIEEEEVFDLAVTVFPNPTSNFLIVDIKNYSPGTTMEIILFDIKGQEVQRKQVTDVQTQLQMEHLASAVYILKLTQGNKQVKAFKVIKK